MTEGGAQNGKGQFMSMILKDAWWKASEIKSAAVDFLLHAVFPETKNRLVVRDTPALCSKTRGSATDGLMALGAVATQLGSHFVGAHAEY